ncbi:MAG: hypothetical protein ACOC2V_07045, partial [Alkalispirochaeta sp.]
VIVTVPVHHIYGFLFGVLLPATLGVPAVDAQGTLLTGDARPRDGDLVISVPFLWERLLTGISRWGEDVVGVSSTAPLPPATARAGCTGENAPGAGARGSRGLARFIEVYGSSETAGIGWRDHCAALPAATTPGFTLFPYWSRAGASEEDSRLHRSGVSREIPASDETGVTHGPTPLDEPGSAGASTTHDATAPPDELLRTNPDGSTSRHPLPDRVEWIDDRTIIPVGRRDAVVQVGGENVDLEELRKRILDSLDDIADCAVRLGGDGRIKLFVVPASDAAARLETITPRTSPDGSVPGSPDGVAPGVAVAGDAGAALTPASIRDRLEHYLPPAALPTSITIGAAVPRDPNGKLTDW